MSSGGCVVGLSIQLVTEGTTETAPSDELFSVSVRPPGRRKASPDEQQRQVYGGQDSEDTKQHGCAVIQVSAWPMRITTHDDARASIIWCRTVLGEMKMIISNPVAVSNNEDCRAAIESIEF